MDDLTERRKVWLAMSELFRDKELTDFDFEHIVSVLRDAPYSTQELERILYHEVFPVLIPNLWSVAGEWTGFADDWLALEIVNRLNRRWKLPAMLIPGRSLIKEQWKAVVAASRRTN